MSLGYSKEFSDWMYGYAREHSDDGMAMREAQRIGHFAYRVCESPIEQKMLLALVYCPFGYIVGPHPILDSDSEDAPALFRYGFDAIIYPQYPLLGGRYRADFLVQTSSVYDDVRFVVECDGHDFHERTKEQAARDRKRDRDIQAAGIPILRFTGSEIYRDIESCADQIDLFGAKLIERTDTFKKYG